MAALLAASRSNNRGPNPVAILRLPSKTCVRKMTNDARIASIEESIAMLKRTPNKYLEMFSGEQAKLDAALADLETWRARMIECQKCDSVAEISQLIKSCWDSPLVHEVRCPNLTRTGKFARMMFQFVAMRQLFLLSHYNPNEEKRSTKEADKPGPTNQSQPAPEKPASEPVPDEPLD